MTSDEILDQIRLEVEVPLLYKIKDYARARACEEVALALENVEARFAGTNQGFLRAISQYKRSVEAGYL